MGLFKTWKEVMFNPMGFYEQLPDKIKYKEPSLFYIKIQLLCLLIIFSLVVGLELLGISAFTLFFNKTQLALIGAFGIGFLLFILVIIYPILILVFLGLLFVWAGILHLFVLFFGGKGSYVETFKVISYSTASTIFSFIPFLNLIIGIYTIILQVIGIHKRHKLDLVKSISVVLLPGIVMGGLFLIIKLLI